MTRGRVSWGLVAAGLAVLLAGCAVDTSGPPPNDEPPVVAATQALSMSNCPAGYHVIQGTAAADTLIGTSGNDCIIALGGDDTIYGGGGDDYIAGGNGDDHIYGEAGNDQLFGEGGLDTIHGGADDDVIHGDNGNDLLYGDDGDDVIDGDANQDTIWGGNGDDVIYGDAASDTLRGEAGDDALIGGAGANTSDGGPGIDACRGANCEKAELSLSGCTRSSQCGAGKHCIADFGLCIGCVSDQDNDGACDSRDACPNDASKLTPGACGCGISDADSDVDGTANCIDACPNDSAKVAAGVCGCGVADTDSDTDGTADCLDACPSDALKTAGGVCGCGVSDADSDGDDIANCADGCPNDAAKATPGVCGCGVSDADTDVDGAPDCLDGCPTDPTKASPGICGCGTSDFDSDGDGTADCADGCPTDPGKVAVGACGCGIADTDSDGDGALNCHDGCPNDATKVAPGTCGCGVSEADGDADGTPDCRDRCPGGNDSIDADGNGIPDACEQCNTNADCSDANACTGTETCSGGMCRAGAPLNCDDTQECTVDSCSAITGCAHQPLGTAPVDIVNGDFATGSLNPFNNYVLTSSVATVGVASARAAAQSPLSLAAELHVGRSGTTGTGNFGGGITQSITSAPGTLIVSLFASSGTGASANTSGGLVRLLIDGVEIARHDFGQVAAASTKFAALSGSRTVGAGAHMINVEVTRTVGFTDQVTLHLDEIRALGSAVAGDLSARCNGLAGTCVAGTCVSCLRASDCDDHNACTLDSCDALAGCQHATQTGQACGAGGVCGSDSSCSVPTSSFSAPQLVDASYSDFYVDQWTRRLGSPLAASVRKVQAQHIFRRERFIVEFDVSRVVHAADLVSARLHLTPSAGGDMNLYVCAYPGDGVSDFATDPQACPVVAATATVSGVVPTVVDVTAAVQGLLSQGRSIVGFNLRSIREQDTPDLNESLGFFAMDNAKAPELELELADPVN